MNVSKSAVIIVFCFIFSTVMQAQKNEVNLSVGAIHSSDQTEMLTSPGLGPTFAPVGTSTNTGVALEGNYARDLFGFGGASLGFELPLVGVPGRDVKLSATGIIFTGSISTWSLFFTPAARLKFHAGPIEPFVSVGGGWAHFNTSAGFAVPVGAPPFSFSTSSDHGALQFGGGMDFKTPLPHVAVRAEVRDFWATGTIQPGSFLHVSPERQHNIFGAGGVVFRF